MPTLDFANELMPTNSIDIPEIGNFCLEAINDDDILYYYLMVKAELGTASIMWYGPVAPDIDLLPSVYTARFERYPVNDTKLIGWVKKWLNEKEKGITSANIIDQKQFMENFRDLKSYMEANNGEY